MWNWLKKLDIFRDKNEKSEVDIHWELGFDDAKDEMVRLEELNAAKKEVEKVSGERPVSQKMFKAI